MRIIEKPVVVVEKSDDVFLDSSGHELNERLEDLQKRYNVIVMEFFK